MKIAILANAGSSHIVKWANSFAGRGHKVVIYSFSQHRQQSDTLDPSVQRKSIGRFSILKIFCCTRELRNQLQIFEPDIVHVFYATVYATIARFAHVKPRILTVMGSDVYSFPLRGFLEKQYVKFNLRGWEGITSASRAMKKRTQKFTKSAIEVIPFGVDIQHFSPSAKKTASTIRIAFVKLLKPIYAPLDMITAFCLLKNSLREQQHPLFPKVKLDFYGTGPLERILRRKAAACDYAEDITFHGYIENRNLPKILQQSDIFCATSLQESFGVSLVEAMACGLPVVCSDAEGFKEIIVEGETGYILPRRDCTGYASALYRLVCDKELRKNLGRKARERAVELYNNTSCVDQMLALYEKAIKKTYSL